MAALGLPGAVILRSPKDAANQPKKATVTRRIAPKSAPSLSALTPPTPPARALVIKPPKPFHLTFLWNPVPEAWGYTFSMGTNGQINQDVASTTNNWFTKSNLWPKTEYVFLVKTLGTNGMVSNYSPPCYWPQPWTNYTALGDSVYAVGPWRTNAVIASTDQKLFFRGQRRGGMYEVITSPDLKMWTPPVTNWAATNVVLNNVLRHSRWSNWDYAHPD